MKYWRFTKVATAIILFGVISTALFRTISPMWLSYTSPYYTDAIYEYLDQAFNQSQYRQKNPTALIPDETVFSYAAGAYIRGVDPILVNSEHTPLGKYIIGLFIHFMKNDRFTVLPFAVLTLIALWLLGSIVLRDSIIALVPVAIFATEPLFLNQIRVAPLLDIIQLPWILFAIVVFLWESRGGRFIVTAVMIGLVMATKTIVPAVLLIATFMAFLSLQRQWKHIVRLFLWLSVSGIIFMASYTRTFMSGYTLADFIGFQKWIFLYQQSKLIFPFSVWRLLLLNQWQAWWGDMRVLAVDDWRFTWPVSTTLGFAAMGLFATRRVSVKEPITLLILWVAVLSAFLSLGVVSSRFFLPLFPVSYVVGVWTSRWAIQRIWH